MKNKLLTILFFKLFASFSFAQTLFDDAVLANIYVNIDPDTLAYIYENPTLDIYFPAQFIFQQGSVSDTVEQIGFRLRGNSSRFSAKKSFKISFNTFVTGRRYQGVKKINLNGEHNDPTLIREKLFYDIWHTADMPERRTRFAKLFINNNYNGLYTLLEEFDKDWLERVFNEQDGNLYKCTYPADLEYINENQQTYKDIVGAGDARAYDLKTNETEDDYSGLVHLITILNQPPNDAFVDSIQTILEVNNTLKALAIDVATGNWDDYAYNRNNYYLYQNATTNKFTFITYDPDNCAGVDFVGADWSMRDCLNWLHPSNPRPLMSKLLAIPQFKNQYILYLDSITQY
ncbi:MAG: CotH kinase family protein, partial [Saprospiraceae bacterium]